MQGDPRAAASQRRAKGLCWLQHIPPHLAQ
eukprot:COSAG06_NODE_119_length_23111_cov_51.658613_24_plen_30_part_00